MKKIVSLAAGLALATGSAMAQQTQDSAQFDVEGVVQPNLGISMGAITSINMLDIIPSQDVAKFVLTSNLNGVVQFTVSSPDGVFALTDGNGTSDEFKVRINKGASTDFAGGSIVGDADSGGTGTMTTGTEHYDGESMTLGLVGVDKQPQAGTYSDTITIEIEAQ